MLHKHDEAQELVASQAALSELSVTPVREYPILLGLLQPFHSRSHYGG